MGRKIALLLMAVLLLAPLQLGASAQDVSLPGDSAIREILVERVDAQRRNTGIVVGITSPQGRRVIAYGGTGRTGLLQLDGDTVFEIGSVTKVFTSVLLAGMAERGEVSLQDSVARYLPPNASAGWKAGRAITLADLATHTSGLPFWPSGIPTTREGALAMAAYSEDQLFGFLSSFDIPDSVGSKWAYSNIDAGVLGLALGRRAGMNYEELLKRRVTGPLAMNSTAVALSPRMKARLAAGHDAGLVAAPAWNVPMLVGAGSLHSSVNDLLNLLDSFAKDQSDLNRLLPVMLETRRQGPGFTQALGWWIMASGPQDAGILAHDGGTLGYASSIAYDPTSKTGVVVLSNTVTGVGDIARHLLRPAIPLTKPAAAAPPKTAIRIDPSLLDRYAGDYEPGPGAVFKVTRTDDGLAIQIPGLPLLSLRPESETAFFVPQNTRVTVTFETDSQDEATRLILASPDGTTPARRAKRP